MFFVGFAGWKVTRFQSKATGKFLKGERRRLLISDHGVADEARSRRDYRTVRLFALGGVQLSSAVVVSELLVLTSLKGNNLGQ
jgi:hypothetical protein